MVGVLAVVVVVVGKRRRSRSSGFVVRDVGIVRVFWGRF